MSEKLKNLNTVDSLLRKLAFTLCMRSNVICLILPSFSIPQLLGNELLISFSTLQLDTSGVENSYFPHR